jgi:hypothetical protein
MAAIAISLPGMALSQTASLEAQRAVVVKLRIHRKNQSSVETAAGLFIGKDQENAYFITAYHAIAPNSQGAQVDSIQLQFHNPPQNFPAFPFDQFNEGLDLGVVRTVVSNLPKETPHVPEKDVAADVPVHVIGHPSAGEWSVWRGSVQNENVSGNDFSRFTTNRDESLAGGYSGGPVFDSEGNFLGMHTSTVASYGIAAKSRAIVDQLSAWRVPANNLTAALLMLDSTTVDAAAIKKVLGVYEDAYNQKDINALARIWPGIPQGTRRALENSFGSARSIRVKLQLDEPVVESGGTSATVTGQFSEVFTPKNGSVQTTPNESIGFILKKKDAAWTIVDVK